MKVLAVGDSFMPTRWFEQALAPLKSHHELSFLQLDGRPFEAMSPSERRLRECEGDPEQLVGVMDGVEVLVVHGAPVTDRVMDASPLLRMVGCARGGPVNVDLAAATERGIPLVVTPGKNAEAVADLTIAFCILLARRLPSATRFLLEGNSLSDTFAGARFMGHDLRGLRLGLVGFGQVGERVAARASAFGSAISVFDPFVEVAHSPHLSAVGDLEALLAEADIVSLHARATSDNVGLIDEAALKAMAPGALLVNTARESLIDEDALDAALDAGHLGGAALDVVQPYTPGTRHRLLRHPNVVLTPHVGGATAETLLQGAGMIAAEIERLAADAPLAHVANPGVLR